jgi:hypothetical protein
MNELRAIIRCMIFHPWSTVDEIGKRLKLTPDFVKKKIQSDVRYEKRTIGKGKYKLTQYRIPEWKPESEE